MNIQLNTIILRETIPVLKSRRFIFSLIFNLIFFAVLSYIFLNKINGVEGLQNLMIQFTFIILPTFSMWVLTMPMLQEKFSNEKLTRIFEAMLTTPLSLTRIWLGKLISMLFLSYISLICTIIVLYTIWNMMGLNLFSVLTYKVWFMAILIVPMYSILFNAFSAWSILRFAHSKTTEIINFFGILVFVLMFLKSNTILDLIVSGDVINNNIILYSVLVLLIYFLVVFILMKSLNKEKVTI